MVDEGIVVISPGDENRLGRGLGHFGPIVALTHQHNAATINSEGLQYLIGTHKAQ